MTSRCSSRPSRTRETSCGTESSRARAAIGDETRERFHLGRPEHGGGAQAIHARIDAQEPRGRGIPRADAALVVDGDDAGRDAVEHGFDVLAAAFDVFVLALELDRRALEPSPAGGQVTRHAVERLDQRRELVAHLDVDAVIEVAGTDFVGGRGQHLHRPRDPLRQVETQPGRGHQNHQRQHQKEGEVDRGQRRFLDLELPVVLVRGGQAARARREVTRQVFAGDQHAAHGSVRR